MPLFKQYIMKLIECIHSKVMPTFDIFNFYLFAYNLIFTLFLANLCTEPTFFDVNIFHSFLFSCLSLLLFLGTNLFLGVNLLCTFYFLVSLFHFFLHPEFLILQFFQFHIILGVNLSCNSLFCSFSLFHIILVVNLPYTSYSTVFLFHIIFGVNLPCI